MSPARRLRRVAALCATASKAPSAISEVGDQGFDQAAAAAADHPPSAPPATAGNEQRGQLQRRNGLDLAGFTLRAASPETVAPTGRRHSIARQMIPGPSQGCRKPSRSARSGGGWVERREKKKKKRAPLRVPRSRHRDLGLRRGLDHLAQRARHSSRVCRSVAGMEGSDFHDAMLH